MKPLVTRIVYKQIKHFSMFYALQHIKKESIAHYFRSFMLFNYVALIQLNSTPFVAFLTTHTVAMVTTYISYMLCCTTNPFYVVSNCLSRDLIKFTKSIADLISNFPLNYLVTINQKS